LGFEALADVADEQMVWLGAERVDGRWRVPAFEGALDVDLAGHSIATAAGTGVSFPWKILVLHYLAIGSRPADQPPEVTFADLGTARSYAGVYQGRVINRLCATAGRDADTLRAAAASLVGQEVEAGGDLAFDFTPFPRLTLRLIWHAADEEFPPSATVLLPPNIEAYFCSEDIVVLSELLVARLGGKPF
jgi:hypothetical protein